MTTREESDVDNSAKISADTSAKTSRLAAQQDVCVGPAPADGDGLNCCQQCASCSKNSLSNGNQSNGICSSEINSESLCERCCTDGNSIVHSCSSDSSPDGNNSQEKTIENGEPFLHNGSENLNHEENPVVMQNGSHHPPSPELHENPCLESLKTSAAVDMSNASFFSVTEDRLASPGSESMVTAREGGSSRSCSSLSCPSSSGSSASSLVCALSPDRDSVVANRNSPTVASFSEDQLLESLTQQMNMTGLENLNSSESLAAHTEGSEVPSVAISTALTSISSSQSLDDSLLVGLNELSLISSNVQLQSETAQQCSAFDSLCENAGATSQWKELSTAIRQLHQTVINSTIVEAGGSSCSVAVGVECISSPNCRTPACVETSTSAVGCSDSAQLLDDKVTFPPEPDSTGGNSSCSTSLAKHSYDADNSLSTPSITDTGCQSLSASKTGNEAFAGMPTNEHPMQTSPDAECLFNDKLSDAQQDSPATAAAAPAPDNSSVDGIPQPSGLEDPKSMVSCASNCSGATSCSAPECGKPMDNAIDLSNSRTHTVKISSPVFQRPSIERIKTLVEELMVTDPHQLVLRLSQLLQEMCELLKVRLLSEVHASPSVEQAHNFAKSVCQAYQQVVCVVDAVRPALHALETRFSLNWFSFALHVFNITILEDKDATNYINVCKMKVLSSSGGGDDESSTGGDAGDSSGLVWWSWLARVCQEAGAAAREGHATRVTPHNRHKFRLRDAAAGELPLATDGVMVAPLPPPHTLGGPQAPHACECHYCTSSNRTSDAVVTLPYTPATAALASNNGLYPHIHGSAASAPKRPLFDNPYVGSDVLSEQLLKEWEQSYGDTLAPPGVAPLPSQACLDTTRCCTSTSTTTHLCQGMPSAAPVTSSASIASVATTVSGSRCSTTATPPAAAPASKTGAGLYCCDRHSHGAAARAALGKNEDDGSGESHSCTADEWSSGCNSSSGDESDDSSSGHVDNHCDCCYYHGVHHKQSGGRQKYSDRRDRLLRILNEKKTVAKQREESVSTRQQQQQPYVGDKDIDTILSYIDGNPSKNNKKKQKQRVKKVVGKQKNNRAHASAQHDDVSDSTTNNDCASTTTTTTTTATMAAAAAASRRTANSKSASSSKSNSSSSSSAKASASTKQDNNQTRGK
ncbi:hypothetical protein FHG87_016352 [Trinorchestia longiramus]|nr:hypothetical protein FHG87_016352 [Trinorchestia longiramus]